MTTVMAWWWRWHSQHCRGTHNSRVCTRSVSTMWTRSEVLLPITTTTTVPRALCGPQPSSVVDSPGTSDYDQFIHSLRVHTRNTPLADAHHRPMSATASRRLVRRSLRVSLTPSVAAAGLAYDNLSTRGSLLQVKLRERTYQWLQRHGLGDLETLLLLGLIVVDVLCNTIMLGLHREVAHRFLVDIFGYEDVDERRPTDLFELEQPKLPTDTTISTILSIIIYCVVYLAQAFGLYGILRQSSIFLDTFTICCTLQSIFLVFGVLAMPLLAPVTFLRCCLLGLGLKHSLTLSDRHYHKNEEAIKVAHDRHQRQQQQQEEEKRKAMAAPAEHVPTNVRVNIERPIDEVVASTSLMSLPGALLRSPSTSHHPSSAHRTMSLSTGSSLSSISEGSVALPIRALVVHDSLGQP